MTEKEIEALLAQAVEAYRKIPKDLEVSAAIEAVTGREVISITNDPEDRKIIDLICEAAKKLVAKTKVQPIETGRLNELGNNIEKPLLDCCNDVGLDATWPLRADGSGGRSGYPDIALGISGNRPTYLEAKVIGAGTENSSFRSFYLSPSDNPKVCVNARHLLLAFVHDRQPNSDEGLEQYSLVSYKLVDLAKVLGKIKFEYQSSNKNMYLQGAIIASG